MERVKKGEKYWSFLIYTHGYRILEFTEGESYAGNDDFDAECAAFGNYFHTKEEAEAMAKKLCVVLNGADVIEKWEIKEMLNTLYAALNTEYGITALDSEKERKEKLSNETCLARMLKSSIELLESKVVK